MMSHWCCCWCKSNQITISNSRDRVDQAIKLNEAIDKRNVNEHKHTKQLPEKELFIKTKISVCATRSRDLPRFQNLNKGQKQSNSLQISKDAQPFNQNTTNNTASKTSTYISPYAQNGAYPKAWNICNNSINNNDNNINIITGSALNNKTTIEKIKLKSGYVYILNHMNFDDPETAFRNGSDMDEKLLIDVFNEFKCKIKILKDATIDTIRKTVAKIETKDFKQYAYVVVVILSHGQRHEQISAKDGDYSFDDLILFPMLRNRSLINKPKLFFIQSCKGNMAGEDIFKDDSNGSPSEILKCYATFEGFAAYRLDNGSVFITNLCDELKRNGKTKDIHEIMRNVTVRVKYQLRGKQIPTYTSNLTERFVFGDYI